MLFVARIPGVIVVVLLGALLLRAQDDKQEQGGAVPKKAAVPAEEPAAAPALTDVTPAEGMGANDPLKTETARAQPKEVADGDGKAPAADPVAAPTAALAAAPSEPGREALVSEIVTLERLRKEALREYGMASLAAGRKALRDGDFEEARKQYMMAETYIPDNLETRAAREEARIGVRDALYRNAQLLWKKGDREKAVQIARQANEKGHPDAAKLTAEIQKEIEQPPKPQLPKAIGRMHEATYKEDRDEVMRRLRVARQHYIVGEYDRSRQELELILRDHPSNTEAMEMMEKLGDRQFDVWSVEYEATRSKMISDVKANWTPRRYAIDTVEIKEPSMGQSAGRVLLKDGITIEQSVEQKMRGIVIPEINFRNANIADVITFFENASREYDDPSLAPEKRGVNFVLRGVTSATPAPAPVGGDVFAEAPAAATGGGSTPITFSARFVNLWDALKIVTEVANFKHQIRGNVVMVMPFNVVVDIMDIRSYTVMPNVIDRATGVVRELQTARGGLPPGGDAAGLTPVEPTGAVSDLKKLFGDLGVAWPVGSSISYLSIIGKLRVVNTVENLAVFEKVLEEMNVTPRQIEIEARFVEVSQTDLDSLGIEWQQNRALTHNYDPARIAGNKNGGTLILNPSTGGSTMGLEGKPYDLSQGMRYLTDSASPLGGQVKANDSLFALQGVFGELDITTVLHMLSQRSNSDLLSAPKVVTKAGQEAVIKVVTEYIYPTTFTVTGLQGSSGGTAAGSTTTTTGAVVEPGGFQTREVGVILQVVPEVSAEGQMINLTMNPQVVSEPTWKNYGSRVPVPNTDPVQYMDLPMEQPFFKIRSVSTSVSIYNGATVVMGGMITEIRNSSEDKVPLLGDLPYIGYLFRSKAEHSEKRNLLIFVTARLVDPAGRAVKTNMEPALSGKKTSELIKMATP